MRRKRDGIDKEKKRDNIFTIILSICDVIAVIVLFLLYGPYNNFRDWLVTTAMSTMRHQYIARTFYNDETINKVLERHSMIEPDGNTDTSLILEEDNNYKDKYDKEILDRNKNDIYKLIEIEENGYRGYLVAIYDPSKIKVTYSRYLGSDGEYLVDMAKRKQAIVAINGGGFVDINGESNGGNAAGVVISEGKIIQGGYASSGLIGFTNDNKMYLGYISATEAINKGIRDAVEFGPFLIVNGKKADIRGNGGYGIHPRAAIGQRQDGIVLFLVIDGRRTDSMGASIKDEMEIMAKYGAINAANLDGGNSAVLVINDKIVNRPIDWYQREQTRKIATGFVVVK